MPIDHAFDQRCETMATTIRLHLGRSIRARLPLDELLADLGVQACDPSQIPEMSESSLQVLFGNGAEDWSAVTISSNAGTAVIFNPLQSRGKRTMAITHEVAHVLLRHTPSTLMFAPDATWTLQTYGLQEEAEAEWLTGCLLLPTPVVSQLAFENSPEYLWSRFGPWESYGVTLELFRYRWRATGALPRGQGHRERKRAILPDPPNWD